MKVFVHFALALLALLAPAFASAQQRPHVDPSLRLLMRKDVREAIERAPRVAPGGPVRDQPLGGVIALDREGAGGAPRVGVLVRVRNPAGISALRRAGAQVGSVIGAARGVIATARVPLDALPALTSSLDFDAWEAARTLEVEHDSSTASIHVQEVRQQSAGVWSGFAGQGVVVAIYDTGLDYLHEDFRDPSGATRLLGLWDQTAAGGAPPAPFDYGHYCAPASLNDGSCPQHDLNGHGTHVAGSAAGDGSATGNGGQAYQYAGVAPGAELLIVKGGNVSFGFDRIIDGVKWIFDEAARLGRPAVVNLSLGTGFGPHDGSTLFEQALDALAGPGRLIVAAAGNDGSNGNTTPSLTPRYLHALALPAAGATQELIFEVPNYNPSSGACNDVVQFDVWYEGEDRYELTLVRPDGSSFTVAPGQSAVQNHAGGQISIDNASQGANPQNGDFEALMQATDCGTSGAPAPGLWSVRVRALLAGSGRPLHLWLYASRLGGIGRARGLAGFDNGYVIASPGSARNVITVGAYASRVCWPTAFGEQCYAQREQVGDIARFSSGGPTRDGRLKPEIAAPGLAVMSALSRDVVPPSSIVAPDGVHWAIQGTSMAAPHVTGALGILLQHNPQLRPEDVRAIFSRATTQDAFTTQSYTGEPSGTPNNQWGYGKLHVRAALEAIGAFAAVAAVSVTPGSDTLPESATRKLVATATSATGDTLSTPIIWRSTNPAVASVDAAGLVRGLATGAATITASAGSVSGSAAISVVPPSLLVVNAQPVPGADAASSARDTRLPLLRIALRVDGHEAVDLRTLGFELRGEDPGARLLLVHDLDRDGTADPEEPLAADTARPLLAGQTSRVLLRFAEFRIAGGETAELVAALRLSGATPNGATFQLAFVPEETHSLTTRSQRPDRVQQPAASVASVPRRTTLLGADEVFALSENPVRSSHVIFNFGERPQVAGVYTLGGRRVIDLLARMSGSGRVDWDLNNDDGNPIAPGVYLIVFQVGARTVREKLFVVRPAAGSLRE